MGEVTGGGVLGGVQVHPSQMKAGGGGAGKVGQVRQEICAHITERQHSDTTGISLSVNTATLLGYH